MPPRMDLQRTIPVDAQIGFCIVLQIHHEGLLRNKLPCCCQNRETGQDRERIILNRLWTRASSVVPLPFREMELRYLAKQLEQNYHSSLLFYKTVVFCLFQ